jgi:ABC-type Fe3+ transport system substrate-binding protein
MRVLLAVVSLVLTLTGCGRPPAQAAATDEAGPASAGDELVILSPHNEYIRYEFGHGFERWYQAESGHAVKVDWRDFGGTSDDVKYISSNFDKSPQGIAIDLFFGGGVPPYEMLATAGLFQPYQLPAEILQRIPARYPGGDLYDPQFRYYGAVLSGFGILYNREVLRRLGLPEPQSWEDLASPQAFSWVGMADPRSSGSALMVYEIILQAYGWEKGWDVITRLGANSRYFTASAAAVPKDVALGEVAMGGAIDFYARTAIARYGAERLGFVLPAGKTVVNPDPIAILKGAPHLELAQAFVRFVMSEEGQRLWFLPVGAEGGPQRYQLLRMPILPDFYTRYADVSGGLASPFDWKTDFLFDGTLATRRRGILADLLGAFIIDTQYELIPAWRALIAAGLPPEAERELTRMPLTGDVAVALAEKWEGPAFVESRVGTITGWCRFAVEKYRQAQHTRSASPPLWRFPQRLTEARVR